MGLMDSIKYARKSMVVTSELRKKTETELNNLLFDLKTKYAVEDDDWIRVTASISLLTQRKIMEQMGVKNDELVGVGEDSNVDS